MTARPRSHIGTLAACGVLLAIQAFVPSATTAIPASPCEELRAWAEPYRDTSLTLDELAGFDRPHRLAIFGALSPTVRSQLWREQLGRFDMRPELTPEQHAIVRQAVGLATPQLYAEDPHAQNEYRRFWRTAAQAFPSAEHKRLWYDLGSIVPGAIPTTNRVPFCNCSSAEPFEGCPNVCTSSPCNDWSPGCGAVGQSRCDGLCT